MEGTPISVNHVITLTWSNGSQSLSTSSAQTSVAETNFDSVVAPGTTNQEVDVLVNVAQLKSIFLTCNVPIKVGTNSPTAQEVVYLQGGVAAAWTSLSSQTMLFTTNAAKFFLTTASSINTATLSMRILTQASSF